MPDEPEFMSDRPHLKDDPVDVISDVLAAVRLTTRVFGRFEVSAPWALRVPAEDYLALYVMARGSAWLELETPASGTRRPAGDAAPRRPDHGKESGVALSAGDVVLLPRGSAHLLTDHSRAADRVHTVAETGCPRPTEPAPIRFGGGGSGTAFVAGAFRFGAMRRHILLESLPPIVHLAAGDVRTTAQVAATVQLILAESAAPGPGSPMLSARLADILLVHALRALIAGTNCREQGLSALSDPVVGLSLRLIHGRPGEHWSVETLAHAAGASRSSFAGRFTELVGQPPLQYLTEWRMAEAAAQLRETDDSVAMIAERVGYRNAAAFMKAFTRVHGRGPGGYRRATRHHSDAGASRTTDPAVSAELY
jgi:AraC-like DNA-binding protein